MIKNYILVAFRHLKKQPGYALLNILGLTIGIVSSLLIVLYLSHELSYDKYHENGSRLYRVGSEITEPDNSFRWATSQLPLGKTLKEEFSEVSNYTRVFEVGRLKLQQEDLFYLEEEIYMADSTMFDLFSYEFISGNPKTSLEAPNSIVLSESLAKKIFKTNDPLGQVLKTEARSYEVKGVYRDVPKESHLRPNALISINSNQRIHTSQSWGSFNMYNYILLNEGVDKELVESKMEGIIDKYVAVIFDQFDITIKYELINVPSIHLYSDFEGEPEPLGSITHIYVFSAIALFLILLASINYMNLSTARSMKRSLEVGVRKVLGAQRPGLIKQFLTESFLLTVFSLFLSLGLLTLLVPIINNQLGTQMNISDLLSLSTVLIMIAIL
ncbi:MAG: ABC transporter permease, partial [Bacteroidota bacterium]